MNCKTGFALASCSCVSIKYTLPGSRACWVLLPRSHGENLTVQNINSVAALCKQRLLLSFSGPVSVTLSKIEVFACFKPHKLFIVKNMFLSV